MMNQCSHSWCSREAHQDTNISGVQEPHSCLDHLEAGIPVAASAAAHTAVAAAEDIRLEKVERHIGPGAERHIVPEEEHRIGPEEEPRTVDLEADLHIGLGEGHGYQVSRPCDHKCYRLLPREA